MPATGAAYKWGRREPAADLEALLDAVPPGKPLVVGFSLSFDDTLHHLPAPGHATGATAHGHAHDILGTLTE